ncbi:hypothetical protein PHJA_002511000 [Phtheirospermum japonicum]|uniref:DUF569 domain-containing protein n=1 Tax=Phtheirospermum japonicum TaxID=374723 RepID=A0A830DBI3_9LAMI|nr:hypothetical protein PHJA_002511000 [Phtheirospermum japonicum]
MEYFRKAKTVKLISHKDKYLVAADDLVSIIQDNNELSATWTVEFVDGKDSIRLKSCFGTYLTASTQPFLPGVTGKKVVQTMPNCYGDVATEWEPQRDGMQVRLRSLCGNFLRPNGGLPPWRNSVTHDIPHRPKTWNKLLWDVEIVEKRHRMTPPATKGYFARSRSSSFSGSMSSKLIHNVVVSQEPI